MKMHSIGNRLFRTSVAAFAIAALTCTGCGSSASPSRSTYSGSHEDTDEDKNENEKKPPKEDVKEDAKENEKDIEEEKEQENDTSEDVIEESEESIEPVIENNDRLVERFSDDIHGTALAVITMTWDVVDEGSLNISDYMQISGDMSSVQLTDSYVEYSDPDNNLVYSRCDNHEEFMQYAVSGMSVTVEYCIYSYDHDFDLIIEPGPENKTELQTVKVTIEKNDGTVNNYTFEDIGRRGNTGIWYCSVCSCHDGCLSPLWSK